MSWVHKQIGKDIKIMKSRLSKFFWGGAVAPGLVAIAGLSPKVLYDDKIYTLYLGLSFTMDDLSIFNPTSYKLDKFIATGKMEVKKPDQYLFWTTDKKIAMDKAAKKDTWVGVLVEYKCPSKYIIADLSQAKYRNELQLENIYDKEVVIAIPKGTSIPISKFYNLFDKTWKSPTDMKKGWTEKK